MYFGLPSFILGFHGCDEDVGEAVLSGRTDLRKSENLYDWLGNGVYFWEQNPQRAWEYAALIRDNPGRCTGVVHKPFVLGAIIDPGYCLNFMESRSLELISESHLRLERLMANENKSLPENRAAGDDDDLLLRYLDCAVVEMLHVMREHAGEPPFTTVRGLYTEGPPVYAGTDIRSQTHVQICVRDPKAIKGYFRPRDVIYSS